MNRIAVGAFAALLFVSAGLFWWQGRAAIEHGAPPPDLSGPAATGEPPIELPSAGAHGRGAALPGAKKALQSKEEKRFSRYDRNRDGSVSRVEMLSTRVKAFQKLDTNHDNLLSFEEWAIRTSDRFRQIDGNGDGVVSRAELDAFYAARDAAKAAQARQPKCSCGEAAPVKAGRKGIPLDDEGDPAD
jgi:hypothetical protein